MTSRSAACAVLILTDDQDYRLGLSDEYDSRGAFHAMERTWAHLAENGAVFENAFVNTPICCPSRTTTLSGRYFHNQREPSPTRGGCMHTTIKELDANGLPSWNK